jgi:hypothetical protein
MSSRGRLKIGPFERGPQKLVLSSTQSRPHTKPTAADRTIQKHSGQTANHQINHRLKKREEKKSTFFASFETGRPDELVKKIAQNVGHYILFNMNSKS